MQTLNVIYKYGHFYDRSTGKRIIVKDGEELAVVLESSNSLLDHDPLNEPFIPKTNDTIINEIQGIKGYKRHKQIGKSGQHLLFDINSAVLTSGKTEKFSVTFQLTLVENLYIYETSSISLHNCYCIVDKVINGYLPFFEPLHAYSLNEAHHKTYVHFFNKFGHGTANAFTKFRFLDGTKLSELR